jgi:haloalkane dehalogenase
MHSADSPDSDPRLPVVGPIVRTPIDRFEGLPGFPYVPRYTEVGGLRIAHVEAGPPDAPPVLLMHGEPTWSYLYRKMMPVLADAGLRAIAPDLVGFGRSDKPVRAADHTYAHHVAWMGAWLRANDLRGLTLFCQDWGSLIGLRMVADAPDRFDRIALANGGLPTGTERLPPAFRVWRAFARWSPWFPIGRIVAAGCADGLGERERAAYDAPFPGSRHRIAARRMPSLVPTRADDPERAANEAAWQLFERWDRPFLTLFSDRDPITAGGWRTWQERVPGARGQPHRRIRGAGHFLQEDRGEEVARALVEFVNRAQA